MNSTLSSSWDLLQLFHFFGPKVFFAVICGGLVGLERELKNKPAGIKTNVLICLGSAIYTSVSVLSSTQFSNHGYYGDPSRIAAQIVSGIGFLGGGTIIQARGTVSGLTSAATIWVVAALGVAIGIGHYEIAVACSITVVLLLVAINWFEDRILGRSLQFEIELVVNDQEGRVRNHLHHSLAKYDLNLMDFDIQDRSGLSAIKIKYSGHRGNHKKFVLDLWSVPGIKEVKQ